MLLHTWLVQSSLLLSSFPLCGYIAIYSFTGWWTVGLFTVFFFVVVVLLFLNFIVSFCYVKFYISFIPLATNGNSLICGLVIFTHCLFRYCFCPVFSPFSLQNFIRCLLDFLLLSSRFLNLSHVFYFCLCTSFEVMYLALSFNKQILSFNLPLKFLGLWKEYKCKAIHYVDIFKMRNQASKERNKIYSSPLSWRRPGLHFKFLDTYSYGLCYSSTETADSSPQAWNSSLLWVPYHIVRDIKYAHLDSQPTNPNPIYNPPRAISWQPPEDSVYPQERHMGRN